MSHIQRLVDQLLSDSAHVRDRAIERARELARKGDRTGLDALGAAIRRLSGGPRCEFYSPGVRVGSFAKASAARDELRALASKRQLLNNPEDTQSLLAQIPSGDFHELWAEVGRLGGEQEWRAFQLLATHLIVHAELMKWQSEEGQRSGRRPVVTRPLREVQPNAVTNVTYKWYSKTSEAELGPMPPGALRKLAAKGALQPEDLVRKGAHGKWVKAGLVNGLFPDVPTRTSKKGASGNLPPAEKKSGTKTLAPAPSRQTTGWFQKIGDTCIGPFSIDELGQMISSGTLEENDFLRMGKKGEWMLARDIEDLRALWQSRPKQEPRRQHKQRRESLATRLSKWIDEKLEVGGDRPKEFYQYDDRAVPKDYGLCSDRQCPCPEVKIPRGSGYLYISPEAVEFMRSCKRGLLRDDVVFLSGAVIMNMGPMPVLMCEQGAKLRGIDLRVAAADARRWWKTGKVPLRPTPMG